MNILPKKNWHVRKKENIARVRKDEAEAAEIEREKERKAKLAEQEARLLFLRNKARKRDGFNIEDEDPSPTSTEKSNIQNEADIFTATGNINFFKEAEAGLAKTGTNKEYEEEKKAVKEDYEKKIGLLTYLGQDTLESQGKTAWFNEREHIICKSNDNSEEIGMKSKSKLDPLNEIKKHTNISSYPTVKEEVKLPVTKAHTETYIRCKNPCKKNKKHRKEKSKKKKRKRSSSSDSESQSKKKKKKHSKKRKFEEVSNSESEEETIRLARQTQLAKLREERLKREAHERKRAERLLAGKDADAEEKEPDSSQSFKQKYNSQFNPHLAKQNQERPEGIQSGLQPGVKYWLQ